MNATGSSVFVLKGGHVLALLALFFGTVFSVNFYMARAAIATFSGLESDKPYQDGIRYDDEIARARAQQARGWRVDAHVAPGPQGPVIEVRQRDAAGVVTPGLAVTALFMHPADRRRDVKVDLVERDAGLYQGPIDVPPGRWDLQIEASAGGDVLFRSVSRIELGAAVK